MIVLHAYNILTLFLFGSLTYSMLLNQYKYASATNTEPTAMQLLYWQTSFTEKIVIGDMLNAM